MLDGGLCSAWASSLTFAMSTPMTREWPIFLSINAKGRAARRSIRSRLWTSAPHADAERSTPPKP
jgi:hypothetical protein